jgi:hypothetical protein
LATSFWLAAKLAPIRAAGGHATILHKGDETAGAVLLILRGRDGLCRIATATVQTGAVSADQDSRAFKWRPEAFDDASASALAASERKFDRDLWVVELECDLSVASALFAIT